jgi:hypothetical protein
MGYPQTRTAAMQRNLLAVLSFALVSGVMGDASAQKAGHSSQAQGVRCANPPKTIQGKCAQKVNPNGCGFNAQTGKWEWWSGAANLSAYHACLRRSGVS